MDIYKFLNSKDVKKHLQDIKYEFTPEQALYVILDSRNTSVKDKHDALKELAETYPDFIVEKRRSYITSQPLGQFAESYINLENEVLDKFFKEEGGCYYSARFLIDGEYSDWAGAYSNFQSAFDGYKEYDEGITKIQVKKVYIDSNNEICITFLPNKTATKINYATLYTEQEKDILRYREWMWVDIPVPFKRGDVVCPVESGRAKRYSAQNIMVVDFISSWSVDDWKTNGFVDSNGCLFNLTRFDRIEERLDSHRIYGDESDMCLVGKIIFDWGLVSYDHVWPYLDFEYYRGDFKGEKAIIKLLSNYYKGKIDEELLLNAYFILRSELVADRESTLNLYTEEGAVLAGLKDDEKECENS